MNLKVYWDNGVIVKHRDLTLCFDPQTSKINHKHVLISHAHQDHTAGLNAWNSLKYSTNPTLKIFKAYTGRKPVKVMEVNYGEEFKIEDCRIKVHNSGHILGSAAFQVDTPEGVVAYTGDLNYTDTIITLAASPIDCDTLIIESTYGNGFIFPPREEIYKSMVKWVVEKIHEGKIPVFYAYPIGKAQEVIKMLNVFLNVDVIVHPMIAKINRVYELLGIKLKAIPGYLSPKHHGCVVVYPFSMFRGSQVKNEASALVTGWALNFKQRKGFPLSSHGDFRQILEFIRECKPRKVYTCFGFALQLAYQVKRKLGINAEPLHA